KHSLSLNTLKSWIKRYNWSDERKNLSKKGAPKNKRGAPLNNKNAVGNSGGHGAPKQNKNAETLGFFSKYLPDETLNIIQEIQEKDPLDILWENIQIQYVAIIRAQRIMYVKDQQDTTTSKVGYTEGKVSGEKWEVQHAWDKQATFLNAQSRAMAELRNMIKQYEELLNANRDMATEEQRLRVEKLKVDIVKARGDDPDTIEDDGFIEALKGQVDDIWQE
ncbi:MAG TPA: hypothetical protein GX731_08795, partial [Clostridiales bacterium]|nr:hypothetical protein [Clostridiales bacterium]